MPKVTKYRTGGVIPGIARVVGQANNVYRAYKKVYRKRPKKESPYARTTSKYHSEALLYKRRPRSKRFKRKWRKHKRSVNAVINSRYPKDVWLDKTSDSIVAVANKQDFSDVATVFSQPDITALQLQVGRVSPGAGDVTLARPVGGFIKYVVTSVNFDVTVSNITNNTGITGATNNAFVDMYSWYATKDVPSNWSGVQDIFSTGFTRATDMIIVGGSTLVASDLGVTPFQNPAWPKFIRVSKKKRCQIDPSSTCTFKLALKKPAYFNQSADDVALSVIKKSFGVFLIGYGAPSSTNVHADPVALQISVKKMYHFKVLSSNQFFSGDQDVL